MAHNAEWNIDIMLIMKKKCSNIIMLSGSNIPTCSKSTLIHGYHTQLMITAGQQTISIVLLCPTTLMTCKCNDIWSNLTWNSLLLANCPDLCCGISWAIHTGTVETVYLLPLLIVSYINQFNLSSCLRHPNWTSALWEFSFNLYPHVSVQP